MAMKYPNIGAIQNTDVCHTLYSIHTDKPILKETEERAERILVGNYPKININEMVEDLDIKRDIKRTEKKNSLKTSFRLSLVEV